MTTPPIEYSSSRLEGTVKVLSWSSGTVFLISLIALGTLILLSHYQIIENVSPLILYLPPGCVGGASILTALVALAIKCCQQPRGEKPNLVLEGEPSELEKKDLFTEKEREEAIKYTQDRLEALYALDPQEPLIETEIPQHFLKEPLLPPLTAQESLACSTMLLGDFMDLDSSDYPTDRTTALRFLIEELQELKKIKGIDAPQLDLLIHSFRITYQIATYQAQLKKSHSREAYRQGRKELSRFILEKLQIEKRVIISSGYTQDPAGHTLIIELFLEEETIRGRLLNTGEGITLYHSSEGRESTKYHSLDLESTPFEEFEKSPFLDLITDLRILDLPTSETEHGVEKNTGYSIQDVYEVLLPLWPGRIAPSITKSHTPQYSGSCSLKPFLILIKEALEDQGDLAKLYLELRAFKQQFAHTDLNAPIFGLPSDSKQEFSVFPDKKEKSQTEMRILDLSRIREMLAKLNRFALSLDRKKRLPEDLRQSLLQTSKTVEERIKEAKKMRQGSLLERKIDLSECVEATSYTLHLSNGISMRSTDCRIKEDNTLPPFKKESFSEYLYRADVLIQRALEANQGRLASKLARQVLLSIPNPSDPFWRTKRSEHEILLLAECVKILLKTQTREDKPILTTPNEALLYLKVLTISLSQAESGGVPKGVVALYALQTKMVFNQTASLYSLTHPAYAEIFSDCQNILQKYKGQEHPIKLSSVNEQQSRWEFVSPTFSSLDEMREDQELLFLHTFLQTNPDLLDTKWQGVISKQFDPIYNTFGLFSDHSFWNNEFGNITFRDPQPKWEPIRQLTLLRSLHHYFIFASYLVGDVTMHLKPKETCIGFSIDFNGLSCGSEKRRYITAGFFKPKDPLKLTEGLFLDTFYTLSDPVKEWLSNLFDQSDSTTQNHHLQTLSGVHLEKEFKLSALEIQQLLSIKTYDELMVPQLIGFFTRHFQHLNNPRFQALFAQFLFSLNKEGCRPILEEVMESRSFVKNQLFSFLILALKRTQSLKWNESHLFFLRTFTQCIRYLADSDASNPLLTQAKGILEKHIRQLFEETALSQEEKGKAFYTLISCVPYLDHPALSDLIPLCQEAKNRRVGEGYKSIIESRLEWGEDYAIGDLYLQLNVNPQGQLPYWVLTHDHYLFDQNFYVKNIQEGLYEFHDTKGVLYRLATEGDSIRTYRRIEGQWYEYKNTSPFTGKGFPSENHPCIEGYFTRNVRAWHSLDKPLEVLIIPTKGRDPLCKITNEGIFHPTSLSALQLAQEYDSPLLNHLSRIAPKSDILAWKNEQGVVVQIEIPQYAFTLQFIEGKWRSAKYPGYFLDTHPFSPSLEPYSHYLTLRNTKGKKIAILPAHGVKSGKQKGLEIPKMEYHTLLANPPLITLSLNKKGRVKMPEGGESTIYLIYLALKKHDYALAQKIVSQVKRERPEWEKKWAIWIQDLEVDENEEKEKLDSHPEALSLRLQLRLMQRSLSSAPLSKGSVRGLARDYIGYLEQRKETFATPLSHKEELKILKIFNKQEGLFSEKEIAQLCLRASMLTFNDPPLLEPLDKETQAPQKQRPPPSFLWIDASMEKAMRRHATQPRQLALLTRPGSGLIDNFLYYYAIARHMAPEDPAYQELLQFLRLTRTMEDFKLRSLHLFLLNLITQPENFPTIGELELKPIADTLEKLKWGLSDREIAEWSFSQKLPAITHSPLIETRELDPTLPSSIPSTNLQAYAMSDPNFAVDLAKKGLLEEQQWEKRADEIQTDLAALQEMAEFFHAQKDENPCVENDFARLKKGVRKKQKILRRELEGKKSPYLLNPANRDALLSELETLYTASDPIIAQKKREILAILHNYPDDLRLEKNGKMLKPLSLREFIVYFGTGNDEAIYRSNPSLVTHGLTKLKMLLIDLLVVSTNQTQVKHMMANVDDESAFIEFATAQRVYNPVEEPHLLVFEYFGGIRLRHEQYDALLLLKGTEEDLELEARTGFGKSRILIPLWLFLKSLQEGIAMMTVPSSLFISQYIHLKKILGKAFDSLIVPIQFNRAKANDLKYLKQLSQKLEDAKENNKIILTTIPSLHGMTNLKLKESFTKGTGEEDTKAQTELIELRKRVATHIAGFFDESKECFNIRHRYDYAVGELSAADPKQIESACSLYRELLLDPQLPFNFEFLPKLQSPKKAPPLSENYETQLLPLFAKKIIHRFKIPEGLERVVLQDLQGHYSKECEAFYSSLTPEQLEEYDRLRKQLTTHFGRVLFKKHIDGYSFYPGTRLAIPCADGVIKKTSEFSALEDFIDLTIQANLKVPFSIEEIEDYIYQLKIQALEKGIEEDTENYKFLKKITNIPLMELEKGDYAKITAIINNDLEIKLEFIEKTVLTQIKVYLKKIVSTSFNLIRAIHHILAASGTVSPGSINPRLKTKEDKTAVIGNLLAMWKNSQDNIYILSSNPPEQKLKNLLKSQPQANVLTDAAGIFLDLDFTTTAQIILSERPQQKGVLLYDDEGRELVYERETQLLLPREESLLEIEDLFIFICKSKVIGTDIKMPSYYRAIVTVDRDSYRDLVFQGAGRMRKLAEGQIVGFAIPEEDAPIIFGLMERNFKHLLGYITRVQGRLKGDDAFYMLRLYLEDLIDAAFWDAARKVSTTQEVQTLFQALEQFLVQETQSKPLASLRSQKTKLPAPDAVQQLKNDLLEPLAKFCSLNPSWAHVFDIERMKEQFDTFVDYTKLSNEISVHKSEENTSIVDTDVVLDMEDIHEELLDQISDMTLENETLSDKVTELPNLNYKPADPLPWNGDYRLLFNGKPPLTLLNTPIYFGPNFKRVSLEAKANGAVQKPAYQILVLRDSSKKYKILLLDLHDARAVIRHMLALKTPSSSKENYYLLSGRNCIACDGKPLLHLKKGSPKVLSINLIHKLFTSAQEPTTEEFEHLMRLPKVDTLSFFQQIDSLLSLWPHLFSFAARCKKIPTINKEQKEKTEIIDKTENPNSCSLF